MSDKPSSPKDIELNSSGENVTQRETIHGVLRTALFVPDDNISAAYLATRYDDNRLVALLLQGDDAAEIGRPMLDWLWGHFPDEAEIDKKLLVSWLEGYLEDEARQLTDNDRPYTLVVTILDRTVDEHGRLMLAWLGTSGVMALDKHRQPVPIDVGLLPGEAWLPARGILPENAHVHAHISTINHVERLLAFSSVLRPMSNELPYIGQAAVQRILENTNSNRPVALLDLYLHSVVPQPGEVVVSYRWESPYEATLRWTRSPQATGYQIEQSVSPQFEPAHAVAEMRDARQLIYNVQPPTEGEVYYRVVPVNEDVRGEPSVPIVVTPVLLVPPIIESVEWTDNGRILIRWSKIPQADHYQLQTSPVPDFDSPQTEIVYEGEEISFETGFDDPLGWYYRVRSQNTVYAPETYSQWSVARQAPSRLETPYFERVSPDSISWKPVPGATRYEIRRELGAGQFEVVSEVDTYAFALPEEYPSTYQVRAIRASGDDASASFWSEGVTVGGGDGAAKPAAPRQRARPQTASKTLELMVEPAEDALAKRRRWLMIATGVALVALAIGLIAGLVSEQRFGLLSDATPTPISVAERDATATQLVVNQQNAEQAQLAGTLAVENTLYNERVELNEITISTLEERNLDLQGDVTEVNETADAWTQAFILSNLSNMRSLAGTSTAYSSQVNQLEGTLEAAAALAVQLETERARLQTQVAAEATGYYETLTLNQAGYEEELASLEATLAAEEAMVAQLEAEQSTLQANTARTVEAYDARLDEVNATLTAEATLIANLETNRDDLRTQIAQEATAYEQSLSATQTAYQGTLESLAATMTMDAASLMALNETLEALRNSNATTQAQLDEVQETVAAYEATLTAIPSTSTPTASPSPTSTIELEAVSLICEPVEDIDDAARPDSLVLNFNVPVGDELLVDVVDSEEMSMVDEDNQAVEINDNSLIIPLNMERLDVEETYTVWLQNPENGQLQYVLELELVTNEDDDFLLQYNCSVVTENQTETDDDDNSE